MDFFLKLEQQCKSKNSLLCVGLDPVVNCSDATSAKSAIIEQNKKIISETIDYSVCYKPNIAFYEAWGASGLEALHETLALIPKEIPILLDAKRGDIGNTATAYAKAAFDILNADAITLSPYMGKSSAEPFFEYQNKGFFFYINIARKALSWAPNRVGLVVAGNEIAALSNVRQNFKDAWLLSPGIGAQGGSMSEAVNAGIREDGLGLLPVVVRAIAKSDNPKAAAKEFVDQLNQAI